MSSRSIEQRSAGPSRDLTQPFAGPTIGEGNGNLPPRHGFPLETLPKVSELTDASTGTRFTVTDKVIEMRRPLGEGRAAAVRKVVIQPEGSGNKVGVLGWRINAKGPISDDVDIFVAEDGDKNYSVVSWVQDPADKAAKIVDDAIAGLKFLSQVPTLSARREQFTQISTLLEKPEHPLRPAA